jgi:hypothetical protein
MLLRSPPVAFGLSLVALVAWAAPARAQCPEQGPFQYWTGAGTTIVPGFVAGEEWGTVFNNIPAAHYPLEVLRVGFGWGSVFGGAPQTLEDSIRIYNGGLPNPGAPIATLAGPVLTDGVINEFDLEPLPGQILVNSGPITATIRLFNPTPGLGPAPVHDGNGCQSPRNVIFAVPGGWLNACSAGVSGDWQVHLVYRPQNCAGQTFCAGDGTGSPCPCGNTGAPEHGCDNAQGTGGVRMEFSAFNPDNMGGGTGTITATGYPPAGAPTAIVLRSPNPELIAPAFGDGLRCLGVVGLIRFGATTATGGTSVHSVSHGAGAGTFYYQIWYRNTPQTFCTPNAYNLSNGWALAWP